MERILSLIHIFGKAMEDNELTEAERNALMEEYMQYMDEALAPVSYTHLDVYKRQGVYLGNGCRLACRYVINNETEKKMNKNDIFANRRTDAKSRSVYD